MKRVEILLATLSLATLAWAQVWTLTSSDFAQQDGTLEGITPAAVELRNANAAAIPWKQIVSLEQRSVVPVRSPDAFILYTRDGQKFMGAPATLDDDKLTWRSSLWGEVEVALGEVRGWSRTGMPAPAEAGNEDVVVLQNGDAIRGIIEAADDGLSVVQGNAITELKWEDLRSVSLAKVGDAPAGAGTLRLRIADGSVCLAKTIHLEAGQVHVERSAGAELKLPTRMVQSIQNQAGRARFMAWLEPAEISYTPFTRFSAVLPVPSERLDQVVIDGRTYRDVVQLRPKTTLTVQAPFDGKLHLQYACGNAGRFTDMVMKVSVGNAVIHEAQGIRSPQAGPVIDAAVKKGDRVRIEVDYGQHFDVQDFLWLLDAAFVAP